MNKHKTETITDVENKQVVARGQRGGRGKKQVREMERYKFQLQINESQV